MKYQLDLTKFICPLPVLMTKKALFSLKKGDELHVKTNNSISPRDFEQLCDEMDCVLSELKIANSQIEINIFIP